jgi:hypothetical protein
MGVVLTLGLFLISLPFRSHQLMALSSQAILALRQRPSGFLSALIQDALSVNLYPVFVLTEEVVLVAGLILVGLVLFWRKPQRWSAMLFSLAMITYGPYITGSLDALIAVHPQWRLPASLVQTLGIGCAVLSGYLFPDGQFVPPWTRLLALPWISLMVAWFVDPGLPFNFSHPYALALTGFLVLMVWLCSALLAQADRYRHQSGQMQRRQTKWVLLCMTNTIVTYSAFMLPRVLVPSLSQPGTPSLLYTVIGYPLFLCTLPVSPMVIFIAILRYHLFDIDTVVNRALVYGTLTIILGLIYGGSVVLLQYVLRGFTSGSQVALVGSTLATTALFQPVRMRVQYGIDRRFYRRKYDAAQALAAFSATLQSEVDMQVVCDRLVMVVKETMQPTHVSLWLRPPAHGPTEQARHLERDAPVLKIPTDIAAAPAGPAPALISSPKEPGAQNGL